MKHLNKYPLYDIYDLEDCLQEVFDKFGVKKISSHLRGISFPYPYYSIDNIIANYHTGDRILIGCGKDKIIPIMSEIIRKKKMIQQRLSWNIVVDFTPNNQYFFVAYEYNQHK